MKVFDLSGAGESIFAMCDGTVWREGAPRVVDRGEAVCHRKSCALGRRTPYWLAPDSTGVVLGDKFADFGYAEDEG